MQIKGISGVIVSILVLLWLGFNGFQQGTVLYCNRDQSICKINRFSLFNTQEEEFDLKELREANVHNDYTSSNYEYSVFLTIKNKRKTLMGKRFPRNTSMLELVVPNANSRLYDERCHLIVDQINNFIKDKQQKVLLIDTDKIDSN